MNYSLFFEEMDTAMEAGFFDYWASDRPTRASLVAARRIRNAINAMRSYDRLHNKD